MDLTLTSERAGGNHIYKGPRETKGWGRQSMWSGEGLKGTKAAVQSGVQGSLRSPAHPPASQPQVQSLEAMRTGLRVSHLTVLTVYKPSAR